MIARLLRDKGIDQYIGAARLLRTLKPDARCVLVGPLDPSPNGFTPGEVEGWVRDGVIDYDGEMADVRPALRAAHVYVLPSRGEGMPRSTLEALATGRAVVTTDVPGCRDTVREGWNGFLVPVGDAGALATAMAASAADQETLARMGRASRELAEDLFDVDKVNADLMAMMGLPTAKAG
jgi:glycosyltransferase involved in cell wall biosynthesis